ncbi:MAG: phosphotransferase enzyme family protein [Acidobacteriota bacterium]
MTSEIVTALARCWGADASPISCISRGANAVYRFETAAGRFFLRVTRPGARPLELAAAAIDWQRYLHERGAPVAEPVPSADGHLIEVISESGRPFFAAVTREVQGDRIDFTNLSQIAAWAMAIGRIHEASGDYKASTVFTSAGTVEGKLPALPHQWEQIASVVTDDPLLRLHFELGSRWMRQQSAPTLVTHADVRPGNALISDRGATIIDFDVPAIAWPAYDLARMMLDDDGTLATNAEAHLAALLDGYRIARPDAAIGPEEVWHFLSIRAVLMSAWSLEDGDTDTGWLTRLRKVLAQRQPAPSSGRLTTRLS